MFFNMKITLFITLLCIGFARASLYQTCNTCFRQYNNNNTYYNETYYCGDAGGLNLNTSDHYSYNINNTATFYFNMCGPTAICNNALACIINTENGGEPHILAYPNSDPYYYSYESNSIQMQYYYYAPIDDYRSFEVQVSCDSSVSFQVTNFNMYDDDEVNIYVSSSDICNSVAPSFYNQPTTFSSLSGSIFMAGDMPMFAMDAIAAGSDEATFDGNFYFSGTYNSFKINGTLTNQNGQSSSVQYLVKGNMPNSNPPLMVTYVTLPNQNSPECILLPNSFDDDDQDPNWFSINNNNFYSLNRTYESVFYNKGTTMNVQTWSRNYDYYITLMQRVSDNLPVSIGGPVIATFTTDYSPSTFISELDWTSMSMNSLPSSTFDLPTSWGCQQ